MYKYAYEMLRGFAYLQTHDDGYKRGDGIIVREEGWLLSRLRLALPKQKAKKSKAKQAQRRRPRISNRGTEAGRVA